MPTSTPDFSENRSFEDNLENLIYKPKVNILWKKNNMTSVAYRGN